MSFPERFLDELTARTDIVDVVGDYVHLISRGDGYWACCPFHSEKTPSFRVQQDRQLFYCFGCKKGGDTITFVQEMEHITYPEAIRFLAARAHLEVPEDDGYGQEAARKRKRLLELNRDAARFYFQMLMQAEGRAVQAYLNQRRIGRRSAVNFGMGAAPNAWDALLRAMTAKGYTKSELLDVGLVVQGKEGRLYDRFRNRLMLPVIDTKGAVVGFGSRVLDKSEPKYMNSPDTPVYSKRHVLYGLNLARKTRRPEFILCEGNLDVVTLHQAGFDNAVASMGTALTPEQIRLLGNYHKDLVLCYDNDQAGETATEKALELLNSSGLRVRVLQLPRRRTESGELVKQDPDDFIKFHGPAALEQLLSGSQEGMEFRMAQIAEKYNLQDTSSRAAYCRDAAALIARLDSPTERDIYAGQAAETANVSRETMSQEIERARRTFFSSMRRSEERKAWQPAREIQPRERSLRYENLRSAVAEEGIIRLLLDDESCFPPPDQPPLQPEQFSSPMLRKIWETLWQARAQGRPVSIHLLSGVLTPEEMQHVAVICQQPEAPDMEKREQALSDYITVIQDEFRRKTETDVIRAATERNRRKKANRQQEDKGGSPL